MITLKKFDSRPDYVFSDDERGNTVLIWPDKHLVCEGTDDESIVSCLHTMEMAESGEAFEYAIFNWPMPENAAAYEEMLADISSGDYFDCCPW